MGHYLPTTPDQRQRMLQAMGFASIDDLFADLPKDMMLDHLDLPNGISEMALVSEFNAMAQANTVYPHIFRGAGAYDHYIPSVVKRMVAKEEFVTAYTPYQAEISQGILQGIFEYQSMICALTDMDVSNASVYDGASAAAEAVAMCGDRNRQTVLVSATVHPHTIQTVKTYCSGNGMICVVIPAKDGITDQAALTQALTDEIAAVVVQQPNFFGQLEPAQELGALVHQTKAKYILCVNPIAAAICKTPGECDADIAVGEGQPLGMALNFGGPYLGFMAAKTGLARKLPGRIAGQTVDHDGKRCFVLTLQAREQHIRREKASSNICSNQALCAMTAGVYLSTMGPKGLAEVATQCYDKAHYLAQQLCAIAGFSLVYTGAFFHEFVTTCPVEPERVLSALADKGILGGLPVEGGILWCATEKATKESIDQVVAIIKEVTSQ